MGVDTLPVFVKFLPDSGFRKRDRFSLAILVDGLHEPDVSNACSILSQHVHLGSHHGLLDRYSWCRGQFVEVEFVEIHSGDELAAGLRFEAGHVLRTQLATRWTEKCTASVIAPSFKGYPSLMHQTLMWRRRVRSL